MQGKLPEAVLVYVALQPCQAPNLLMEGGKASLLVGNVPLALAGGEGDRSWGRRPRCQPGLCHALACRCLTFPSRFVPAS